MTPQPIDTAPPGDGWILALAEINAPGWEGHPWAILTRGDGGWFDAEGYPRKPTAWLPLPDPQPAPTGWRKPQGVIRIVPIVGSGDHLAKWLVVVMLDDGLEDPTREPLVAADIERAKQLAQRQGEKLGLPVAELQSPAGLRLAHSGVPITKGPLA